jgi:hypothetical protein
LINDSSTDDVTLTASITESGSGVQTVVVSGFASISSAKIGSVEATTKTSTNLSFANLAGGTLTIVGKVASGDGTKALNITSITDAAGNSGGTITGGPKNIVLDATAPTASITEASPALINDSSTDDVTLTASITESGSGVQTVVVSGFASISSAKIGTTEATAKTATSLTFANLAGGPLTIVGKVAAGDGTKAFNITSITDAAGNSGGTITGGPVSITLDSTPPSVTKGTLAWADSGSGGTITGITASDAGSGLVTSGDVTGGSGGGSFAIAGGAVTLTITTKPANGASVTFNFTVYDNAGNSTPGSVTVTVDASGTPVTVN